MPFVCKDLAEYGVILVPPTRAEYFHYLEDIERRLHERPAGALPLGMDADQILRMVATHDTTATAILLNRASHAIASVSYIWTLAGLHDRPYTQPSITGTNALILLPFGMPAEFLPVERYWKTILPGSKRLLNAQLGLVGDNTDVRAPREDELLNKGFVAGLGGYQPASPAVSLTIDGVFFEDGGFAGQDTLRSWDRVVSKAQAFQYFAALASRVAANDFLAEVKSVSGVKGDPLDSHAMRRTLGSNFQERDPARIRTAEKTAVAAGIQVMWTHSGEQKALDVVRSWAGASVPRFHKL